MKAPMSPPPLDQLMRRLQAVAPSRPADLLMGVMNGVRTAGPYLPWDEMRRRPPPEGMTHEEWWLIAKLERNSMKRRTPLVDKDGREFTYALPDEVLRG